MIWDTTQPFNTGGFLTSSRICIVFVDDGRNFTSVKALRFAGNTRMCG